MKVAIVKQLLDTFGPWSSVRWEERTPKEHLQLWPGKAAYWEITTLLQADWYVIPQQVNTDFTYDSVLRHRGKATILKKHMQRVVPCGEIPFNTYDVVISLDPILHVPPERSALFAYFLEEHWDHRYAKSLREPLRGYDLFLAHMMDARASLASLPQAISFPYVRHPKTLRRHFAGEPRQEAAWADWRMLATLSCARNGNDGTAGQASAKRLEEALGLPVNFRSFSLGLYYGEDPPRWGDAREYLRELGRQKYYLGLGRAGGPGQGLADAASLGCICFGEQDKPYHRLICHPETLCGDLQELPRRFRRVRASAELQKRILAKQDENVARHFVEEPLKLLGQALRLKRGSPAQTERTASPQEQERACSATTGS